MADIFISYAREELQTASRLADRFQEEGWTVFLDRELLGGERWPQRIETEVDKARCVVVLWSLDSVLSSEVRKEALIGLRRNVLVPAFFAPVDPPNEFKGIHASYLTGWDGLADTPGLADLNYAIACRIGNPTKTVTITPTDFVIVVGCRKFWPTLGPTVNLTCRLDNALGRPIKIFYLEASVTGPGDLSYYCVWNLLYDTLGETEHQWRETKTLDIPEGDFKTGVQFCATDPNKEIQWPSGNYRCQILGWADRSRGGQPPNIRTEFDVFIDAYAVGQVNQLLSATEQMWGLWSAAGTASDNARGVRASIGHVRSGLPPVRASNFQVF